MPSMFFPYLPFPDPPPIPSTMNKPIFCICPAFFTKDLRRVFLLKDPLHWEPELGAQWLDSEICSNSRSVANMILFVENIENHQGQRCENYWRDISPLEKTEADSGFLCLPAHTIQREIQIQIQYNTIQLQYNSSYNTKRDPPLSTKAILNIIWGFGKCWRLLNKGGPLLTRGGWRVIRRCYNLWHIAEGGWVPSCPERVPSANMMS